MQYPSINGLITKIVDDSNFEEAYDFTNKNPMYYDGINHNFYINKEEINKTDKDGNPLYDAEYLTATNLLYSCFPYSNNFQGLRLGYSAGAAATVGQPVLLPDSGVCGQPPCSQGDLARRHEHSACAHCQLQRTVGGDAFIYSVWKRKKQRC